VTDFKTQASRSQGVFYDDVKETSFDYPRMMKGSISHVETEHYNKDIRFLSGFYFSNYLPVHNASYSISFPDDVDVRYIIKNDDQKIITVKESSKGKKKKLEFSASDITSYEHFGNGTSISYYAVHVIVYVASYKNAAQQVPVFNSLDALYKWNVAFLSNINLVPDDNLKKITDSICQYKKTDREKAQAIYYWVQNHVKYVAFEEGLEGFIPRQAADVCTKRYGDCKDMASILTAMLRISGLNACFTWIGTRSIPYKYSEVPLPVTDNHMISAVNIDKNWIFLDATDPNCIFGFPSSGIQGKEALVSISPDKYEVVNVPVMPSALSVITDSTFINLGNNTLTGTSSVRYAGYFGSDLHNSLSYNKGDDERVYARSRMAKGSNKFIMSDYKIRFDEPMSKSANISAGFEIPGYPKFIGDEIYINLNLEKLIGSTPIDTSKRKVAIENDHLYTINQVHVLKVPAGYAVDYLPGNTSLANDVLDFSIIYKQVGEQVFASQQLVLKKLYIQPADFIAWNNAVSMVSPAYKEQVVLKKK
jgi:transglutaminase-like putative cysteine protease